MDTITLGNRHRIFLKTKFKYEGKVLAVDNVFLKLHDEMSNNIIIIPLEGINNIEEVSE